MITAEITVEGGITAEIAMQSTVSIVNTPFSIPNVEIIQNVITQIDTGQSTRKPRQVSFYDEVANECIDKSLPPWSSRLNTTWFIDIPKQLLNFTNITVYYL